MTEILLSVCSGALAALVGVFVVLHRRGNREERALRRALESSVLWWWQSDVQGRVVRARPGRRTAANIDCEQMLGKAPWQLPGAPAAAAPAAAGEAMAARRPFFDVPLALPGGGELGLSVRLSGMPLLTPRGVFCGYAGSALLVEAGEAAAAPGGEPAALRQRLAQLERERSEQARQFDLAAREMESFSYSVSHDLRAPLRVVDGFATIILEDYGSRLDTLGRQHVQRIIAAASRMNAMIDALLSLSRRTTRELEIEPFDLSRAALELADELRATERGRNVEFRIEADLRTHGDPTLLRLVLQNLLGNACKFSAKTPHAIIEFGHHMVDGNDVFFVRDNGAGFDMRFAEHLFGLFQRFHSQNDFPGTGVGLATVQRIVRKHGGRVWAESEPGRGACFYFTLQRVAARNAVASV